MNRKITVVGSGNVGASAAISIADRELADVVLIDILEGVPQGKGLDMLQACPIEKSDSRVIGTNDYADTANSDIVIITAGIARKPGMSRDDLLNTNFNVMKSVTEQVVMPVTHSASCAEVGAVPLASRNCWFTNAVGVAKGTTSGVQGAVVEVVLVGAVVVVDVVEVVVVVGAGVEMVKVITTCAVPPPRAKVALVALPATHDDPPPPPPAPLQPVLAFWPCAPPA